MSATATQIAELRLMVDEPTDDTYDSDALAAYIEDHPILDERGESPYGWDVSTSPPTKEDNDNWIPTYDLNAAAARIWEHKAAAIAEKYSTDTDGRLLHRSHLYEHYMRQTRHYAARRTLGTITMHVAPRIKASVSWRAN